MLVHIYNAMARISGPWSKHCPQHKPDSLYIPDIILHGLEEIYPWIINKEEGLRSETISQSSDRQSEGFHVEIN